MAKGPQAPQGPLQGQSLKKLEDFIKQRGGQAAMVGGAGVLPQKRKGVIDVSVDGGPQGFVMLNTPFGQEVYKGQTILDHYVSVALSEILRATLYLGPDTTCDDCDGDGKVKVGGVEVECRKCGGTGSVKGELMLPDPNMAVSAAFAFGFAAIRMRQAYGLGVSGKEEEKKEEGKETVEEREGHISFDQSAPPPPPESEPESPPLEAPPDGPPPEDRG